MAAIAEDNLATAGLANQDAGVLITHLVIQGGL
jgi:hypothetical protein